VNIEENKRPLHLGTGICLVISVLLRLEFCEHRYSNTGNQNGLTIVARKQLYLALKTDDLSPFHSSHAWIGIAIDFEQAGRAAKDLRQKLPVLSGYMAHALLKSTELYLQLVPDRFVKLLSRLQEPPNRRKDAAA